MSAVQGEARLGARGQAMTRQLRAVFTFLNGLKKKKNPKKIFRDTQKLFMGTEM